MAAERGERHDSVLQLCRVDCPDERKRPGVTVPPASHSFISARSMLRRAGLMQPREASPTCAFAHRAQQGKRLRKRCLDQVGSGCLPGGPGVASKGLGMATPAGSGPARPDQAPRAPLPMTAADIRPDPPHRRPGCGAGFSGGAPPTPLLRGPAPTAPGGRLARPQPQLPPA